ncbi:hypothetical protein ACFUT3_00280 [Streptomyces cinereoruber]|uniref:hypothetical protein n=1 Tax=Streptomyces cinereoruber TaxID=67260 RepID=UPI0036277A97
MEPGQVAVEDEHVVRVQAEPLQGVLAVVDGVDGESGPPQPGGDEPGENPLVLRYEYTYAPILSGPRRPAVPGPRPPPVPV